MESVGKLVQDLSDSTARHHALVQSRSQFQSQSSIVNSSSDISESYSCQSDEVDDGKYSIYFQDSHPHSLAASTSEESVFFILR